MRLSVVLGLAACFLLPFQGQAAWDIFQSYVILDSGSGDQFLAGGLNADGATAFAGNDLGDFTAADALTLNGGELKTYKNSGSNVCGGTLNYRVYASGDTPGTFTALALPYDSELANPGDQKWAATGAGIDLLGALTAGDYVLELYWEATGDDAGGCSDTKYDSNFGNNFTATFSIVVPGCTDPAYAEYDAAATTDDGSCATLIDPCENALVLGSIEVDLSTTTLTAEDGSATLTVTAGTPTSLTLSGINGAADYTIAQPGAIDGIAAGSYSVMATDANGCTSNTLMLIMPYSLCCDCGVSDQDSDGLCDDVDNCSDRLATNFDDPANEACIGGTVEGCMDPAAVNYNPNANRQPTEPQISIAFNLISDLSSFPPHATSPIYRVAWFYPLSPVGGYFNSPLAEYWDENEFPNAGTVVKTVSKPETPHGETVKYRVRIASGGHWSPGKWLVDHFAHEAVVVSGDIVAQGGDTTLYLTGGRYANLDFFVGVCHYAGCTDPDYIEYNPDAQLDDGSCSTLVVEGCTDSAADNYDASANTDDGSCIYYGCTDTAADNYDAAANTDDGSCIYYGCTDTAADNYDAAANTDDGSCIYYGCMDPTADNYDASANTDDGSCIYYGCTDTAADNYDAAANTDDGSCIYYGCTDTAADNYDASANTDDGSCIYYGCTDPAADNYDASANTDDGSCIYYGCTDTAADNYDASANTDDGSCIYYGCTDPAADNYDASANTEDGSCIYYGCTDTAADNYDAAANTDDGSCIYYGCTDPDYQEYDASANTDDGSCQCLTGPGCVSPTMDGYSYDVVQICSQCWFAENLRTTTYADGTAIPAGLTNAEWSSATSGATAVYGEGSGYCAHFNEDIDACDEALSLEEYGRMYNWYAVDDARGLCPAGWHVPTDAEWTELEDYIESLPTLNAGKVLKSTTGWYPYGVGTDNFGFSALPGGIRVAVSGSFQLAGAQGFWWSSSPNSETTESDAWARKLTYQSVVLSTTWSSPLAGKSVRCIQDAE